MKRQEKATELIDKFGSKSIDRVIETIDVWNIKREHELKKLNSGNRSDNVLRGLLICDRTLRYWNGVMIILKNKYETKGESYSVD